VLLFCRSELIYDKHEFPSVRQEGVALLTEGGAGLLQVPL
jgi:hypothetical protein